MSSYLLDSFAILEYLDGSARGAKVSAILDSKENNCFIISEVMAEVVSRVIRKKMDLSIALGLMRGISMLASDYDSAEDAGRIHAKMHEKIKDFGLTDAFVLAAARKHGLKVLTGDQHFKGVPEVIFL